MRELARGARWFAAVVVGSCVVGIAGPANAAPKKTPAKRASAKTSLHALTVENRIEPLGIDAARPRLGWQMKSSVTGQRQTGYQVLVATSKRRLTARAADMWNSGFVASRDSVAIRYDGKELQPSRRYYWKVVASDARRKRVTSPVATFETALMSSDGKANWDGATWIRMAGKAPATPGAPMLRKEEALRGKRVRSARLYASALGVYDTYINGGRVGVPQGKGRTVELLTPGWTNYERTTNYMSYDVTRLVAKRRQVTLAAVLGTGWFAGRVSVPSSKYMAEGGNTLGYKAKLLVRYADGSSQTVVTKPGDGWKATDQGPYVADDIYDGQTYDARKELPGWTTNGFDASKWSDVEEHDFERRFPNMRLVAYPGETARIRPQWQRRPTSITVYNAVSGADESANGRGRIVVDEARSVSDPTRAAQTPVTIKTGDTAIFDLGQNMVGVPRYTVRGPAGAEVQVTFGEMLNDTSAGADGPEGSVYRANYRAAKATSTYVLKGERSGETHQDSLSFYGFRYAVVRVVTPDTTVTVQNLVGNVGTSAIRDIGNVTTDDPLVNQLFSNVRWGQRGNYLWVPTDCPQRDERQGWTGDAQLFANTALYNGDSRNFLEAYQGMMLDSQESYGHNGAEFPLVVPGGFNAVFTDLGVSGWADAGVIIPWTVWQMTGDDTIVDRSWPAMTKYMDWVARRGLGPYSGQGTLTGDWLAFQRSTMNFVSDAYYAYSTSLMTQMARGTGRDAEARRYEQLLANIKRAFVLKYVHPDPVNGVRVRSSLGVSSPLELAFGGNPTYLPEDDGQTALLWVLKLGFYENEMQRKALIDLLAANIDNTEKFRQTHPLTSRANYAPKTLSVGFLGVNVIAPVLTDHGRTDLAYELLHQDQMPSWLYSVKNGATTVWERWNSYSKEDGFGDVGMNSFNHYAYGAVAEWMYEHMAGIARDREHPGFERFFLQPKLDTTGKISTVKGVYRSPFGRITSEWTRSGDTLRYRATVPANSSAVLRIPAPSAASVQTTRGAFADTAGVTFIEHRDGVASFRLGSGSYELTTALR